MSQKPSFDKEKGTVILNIPKESVSLKKVAPFAKEHGFVEKQDFHITILGFQSGKVLIEKLNVLGSRRIEVEKVIENLIDKTSWEFTLKDLYYRIEREYKGEGGPELRESIIQMADMPGLGSFLKDLNTLFKWQFPVPPPHITIYTKGTSEESKMGIGVSSGEVFASLKPTLIFEPEKQSIKTIQIPTRVQIDTLVALFILKRFGEKYFPGIEKAALQIAQTIPAGQTPDSLQKGGILLLDMGGGQFDHHTRSERVTASQLVSDYLGVRGSASLEKLLEFARRDDQEGKGIISTDALDRAFGLSGLVVSLNKKYVNDSPKVAELVLPLLEAHFDEEVRRTEEMPRELKEKLEQGKAGSFTVRQRDKKLKVIVIESDNASLAGFLRSHLGGSYDVVAQRRSSGHVNILVRPAKRIDLRSLVVLIRTEEAGLAGLNLDRDPSELAQTGRMSEIPSWYYDMATNSMQNGGMHPEGVAATKIPWFSFAKILEVGLGEALWSPGPGR